MTEREKEFLAALRYNSNAAEDKIKMLLDVGISPDTCDDNGISALSYAIHAPVPNWKIIDLLLKQKIETDKQDTGCLQMTPLMHALLKGDRDIVIDLLNKGADPLLKDAFGLMAYDYLNLLIKNDKPLSVYTKHYASLSTDFENSGSLGVRLTPSGLLSPYFKYYEELIEVPASSCLICKHFRQHPNGGLYIETGVPGVYMYNRIVYQLFEELSNEIKDGLLWRTFGQDVYTKCPVCKKKYHYHRWWDDEWGSSNFLETLACI